MGCRQAEACKACGERNVAATCGRRAFAIAGPEDSGPSAWNSLPDPVRNPNSTETVFRRLLTAFFLFTRY